MRRLIAVTAFLRLLMASSAIALGSPGGASAEELSIDVVGTGAAENPPATSSGTARARFTFNTDTNVLTYAVTVNGISDTQVTAAHIHRGAGGTNGPVVYPLSTEPFAIASGSITLTAEDVADLSAGNFYLNVHSQANPGGFARAQIVFPGLNDSNTGGGSTVTPPNTGDAGLADTESKTSWIAILGLVGLVVGAGTAVRMTAVSQN